MRLSIFALALSATLLSPAAHSQETQRISGTFTAVSTETITVRTAAGSEELVTLAPSLSVAHLDKGTVSDLKPGLFVGVGARPQSDGSQKAVQIVIFPESMRGTGEGHRAWGVMPEATMTNGAIAETVETVSGPNFTLSYKGGAQKVTTPAEASILVLKIGERNALKAGARGQMIVTRQANGARVAARVTIWGEGVDPY